MFLRTKTRLPTFFKRSYHTPLHAAIFRSASHSQVSAVIKNLGVHTASKMAKTTDQFGSLPIDLVSKMEETEWGQKKDICELLYPLMKMHSFKHLKAPISIDAIQGSLPSEQRRHLALACAAANEARDIIQESASHPQVNDYPKEIQAELFLKLRAMRDECHSQSYASHKSYLEKTVDVIKKFRFGNCVEFSYLALYLLRKNAPEILAETYDLVNGDHTFLVIGRAEKSDPTNYKTWGNNAVICDAWLGEVYPASQIPNKLCGYKQYRMHNRSYLHVPTKFNPEHHTIAPDEVMNDPRASIGMTYKM